MPKEDSRYMTTLKGTVKGSTISVRAFTPAEGISYSLSSTWGEPFDFDFGVAEKAMSLNGKSIRSQALSALAWQGVSRDDIEVKMNFFAESDARLDVVTNLGNLMKLLLPSRDGKILRAPGPAPTDAWVNGAINVFQSGAINAPDNGPLSGAITLKVGRWFFLSPAVITRVVLSVPAMYDAQGYPVQASATITLSPYVVPVGDDIATIIRGT